MKELWNPIISKNLKELTIFKQPVLFCFFINCSSSGDHPSDDLARLGYRLDMKVKKENQKLSIFLATYWNLS
jgi:hypothetical protein